MSRPIAGMVPGAHGSSIFGNPGPIRTVDRRVRFTGPVGGTDMTARRRLTRASEDVYSYVRVDHQDPDRAPSHPPLRTKQLPHRSCPHRSAR